MIQMSAKEAVHHYLLMPDSCCFLDVRSEDEFSKGALPGAINLPILNNNRRHQVGLEYKTKGQAKAIELGQNLVKADQLSIVTNWCDSLSLKEYPFVYCWRGGLRSKISTQWLKDCGQKSIQIIGGYKDLRNELLNAFTTPYNISILSGPTGSGKSRVLAKLPRNQMIDIENLAKHRGSVFGKHIGLAQPSQTLFENLLALELMKKLSKFVIEDESQRIGQVHIPHKFYSEMSSAPRVILKTSLEERVQNIYLEYVKVPLASGKESCLLESVLLTSLDKLKTRLGGLLHSEIRKDLLSAFRESDKETDSHNAWIKKLVTHYYDKTYDYAFNKKKPQIEFSGNEADCLEYFRAKPLDP